jgi:hypothetical protein
LTTSSNFTYETLNAVFTLNTLNLANNTLLYYTTVGNIISADFVSGNTGSFRTTSNTTTISLATSSNIPSTEERFFQLQVRADGLAEAVLLTSNVFTVKGSALGAGPNVEMLLVAGGGGGGNGGGGGGAGGLLYYGSNTTPKTPNGVEYASFIGLPYTITVGAAGGQAVSGNDSAISLNSAAIYTALGGGYGGAGYGNNPTKGPAGSPGGSGGGAGPSPANGTYTSVGTGTAGQGNSGGNGFSQLPSSYFGGAGGGAGAAGNPNAGAGGNGLAYNISGTYTAYAGGGGGGSISGQPGAGGVGGGGTDATPGAVNTGGGGSSGSGGGSGFPGGSGVVILRYPAASYGNATSTTGNPNVTISGNFRTYRFWQSGTITF